jgi:cytochrome c-type protein NapC
VRPVARRTVLLLAAGFALGIVFWGGLHTALQATNTLGFCISCHEMRDTVYAEYRQSVHHTNRSGVRAVCADCHVPRDWGPMVLRKARASLELWGSITGRIDTPAKFEAARMALATREWDRMKASDSRECRNCHAWEAMGPQAQKPSVVRRHQAARADGQTCIDCHKGVAHALPAEYRDPDE